MSDILHIVTMLSADGRYGGPQTVARTVAHSLGHEIWGGASGADLRAEGSRPRERRFRAFGGTGDRFSKVVVPGLWWALWMRSRQSVRPAAVHVHGGSELCGLAAMFVLVLRRCPFVVQPHGMYAYPVDSLRHRVASLLFMPLIRRASAVVALTTTERESLVNYGVARERIVVIANGIDPGVFGERPPASDTPIVAFAGRLQERKHPERFTGAATLLARRGSRAHFVMAGADQGALAAACAADPDGCVEHLGALPLEQARRVIAGADVLVVCSDVEPFGMVAIEALAAETVLLITDSCDLAAELGAAHAALVTAPTAESIAEGIELLLDDIALRSDLVAAGSAVVNERYSMAVVMPQWQDLYARFS